MVLILVTALVFSGCTLGAEKLTGEYEGYYLSHETNVVSVTNYAPFDFFNLPDYQELAEYGYGVGIDNKGIVYSIFITDTSKEDCFYSAEFDGETRQLLCEEGVYFEGNEEAKAETVTRLLDMLDALK